MAKKIIEADLTQVNAKNAPAKKAPAAKKAPVAKLPAGRPRKPVEELSPTRSRPSRHQGEESKRQKLNKKYDTFGDDYEPTTAELPKIDIDPQTKQPWQVLDPSSARTDKEFLNMGNTHTHPWSAARTINFHKGTERDPKNQVIPAESRVRVGNHIRSVLQTTEALAGEPTNAKAAMQSPGVYKIYTQPKFCGDCHPRNPGASEVPPS